jgi:hypothetical protein
VGQVFDPLLQWAAGELSWRLEVSDSICGITQPAATVEAARSYLEGEVVLLDSVLTALPHDVSGWRALISGASVR